MKLILCDLDGTLIGAEELVDERLKVMVDALREKGITFSLATGRTMETTSPFVEALSVQAPYIISNGACIMQGDTCLHADSFSLLPILDVIHYADSLDMTVTISNVYRERPLRVTPFVQLQRERWNRLRTLISRDEMERSSGVFQKVMFYDAERTDKVERIRDALRGYKDLYAITTFSNKAIELAPAGCNKATGIQTLTQLLGVSMEDTMVCGDYVNDIEMIQAAGIGVAVANALPEVKAAADYVCEEATAGGVLEAIRKFCGI